MGDYFTDPIFLKSQAKENQCRGLVKKTDPRICEYFIDQIDPMELSKLQVIMTNSIVSDDLPIVAKIVRTSNSFYGMYYVPYTWHNTKIKKDFNCFINRMDPIRQSWFYQFIRRGLLDQGYVSFNMDVSRLNDVSHLSPTEVFEQQFITHLSIFKDEHEVARTIVPYKNFIEADDFDLAPVVLSSKFSIILETYFDNNDIVTWSEKTFRCLQLPRPWLLFGPAHAVKHLRNMGFDVLDDICYHNNYDNIESEIERQIKILDIAQTMCNIDITPLMPRLEKAAKHNQKLLSSWYDTFDADFKNTLVNAQQQVLQL